MLNEKVHRLFLKRVMDVLFSAIAISIFAPVFALVALLVCTNMGRPILFKQQRPGYKGQLFMLYKFRTMKNDRDKNGCLLPDEKRLTRMGFILRKMSLDELPQLFNVFKGDMSFVGPRPLLVHYLERYPKKYKRRHDMRPGITGLAQINERHSSKFSVRFNYDLYYIDHFSLKMDLTILMSTFIKVFKCHDYHEQQKLALDIDDIGITNAFYQKENS